VIDSAAGLIGGMVGAWELAATYWQRRNFLRNRSVVTLRISIPPSFKRPIFMEGIARTRSVHRGSTAVRTCLQARLEGSRPRDPLHRFECKNSTVSRPPPTPADF
jgi:hypothetical protein